MKKIFIFLIFILLAQSNVCANNVIFIEVKVNNKIITNIDVEKEANYLKLLNPNLKNLDKLQLNQVAKKSLINEIIKESELLKYFDFEKNLPIIDKIFEDFYKNLNFLNEIEFEDMLSKDINFSSIRIKEKLKKEFFWNKLIVDKFNNQVNINEHQLKEKLNNKDKKYLKQYSLSEIFFNKDSNLNFEDKINKIKKSITEVGFNNTANIYSISESANYGGQIGWVDERNLTKKIIDELKKIKIGEHTNAIQINNNFIILKIEDEKLIEIKSDKKNDLKKMIDFERNKQLNQYSKIYFNKIKMNYQINEK